VSAVTKLLEGHRAAALLLIVVLGFALRFHGIDQFGFNEDEVHKLEASRAPRRCFQKSRTPHASQVARGGISRADWFLESPVRPRLGM